MLDFSIRFLGTAANRSGASWRRLQRSPSGWFDFGTGLIFGMSSTGGNAADSDDDLIICHVCLNFYNEGDRLPKFLDCHHSFCLSCIKVCRQRFPAKRISVLFCLLRYQITNFITYYSINELGLPSIR